MRYQVHLISWSPPAFDLATVGFQKLGTLRGIIAVPVDSIAAREVLSWAGWIRTHVPVATFEMAVTVALDLPENRVPVRAFPHSTVMGHLVAEVCDLQEITAVAVANAVYIRGVAMAGVVILVSEKLSGRAKPYPRKDEPPVLLRRRPACTISSPPRVLDGLPLPSVLWNAIKDRTCERELTHQGVSREPQVSRVNTTRKLGKFRMDRPVVGVCPEA